MSPVHVREKPPLRHVIDVQPPGGRHYRLGEDEPDPANVFTGLRYSDTMPGGFETADCTLPRKPGVEYADLERLSNWRIQGVGGEVYWEGRLERAPRTSGDEVSVSPSVVGWQAHLDDDKSASMTYIDRDTGRWEGPSTVRRHALSTADAAIGEHTTAQGGLELIVLAPWANSSAGIRAGVYYRAPATATVARIGADFARNANVDTNFTLSALTTDDQVTFPEFSADVMGAAATGTLNFSPTTPLRQMLIEFGFATAVAGDLEYAVTLSDLYAVGDHGITIQGDFASEAGVLASDVVAHAVGRWAPLLQITPDSIQASSFIAQQLAFLEPTTCSEIVRQASRFSLPNWAVWNDREFVWHQEGTRGRTWRLRIGPSELEETGPQADRVWESVIVQYQDVDGTTRTVGPPGSGADTESTDLKDLDPDNPANKLGTIRRDILTMGVSTAAGATEIGRQFLEQARLLDRSGKARVVGWAEDDRGVLHPFSAIRSGDYAVFVDAADTSARKIVRTDKDYDTRTCTLDLDSPPEGLQQLLERLGVVLVPLGL